MNEINVQTNNKMMNSVQSETPIPPIRTPKKVSFSDELPIDNNLLSSVVVVVVTEPTTTAVTATTSKMSDCSDFKTSSSSSSIINNTNKQNNYDENDYCQNDINKNDYSTTPIQHVLQQKLNYLNNLHNIQHSNNNDNDHDDNDRHHHFINLNNLQMQNNYKNDNKQNIDSCFSLINNKNLSVQNVNCKSNQNLSSMTTKTTVTATTTMAVNSIKNHLENHKSENLFTNINNNNIEEYQRISQQQQQQKQNDNEKQSTSAYNPNILNSTNTEQIITTEHKMKFLNELQSSDELNEVKNDVLINNINNNNLSSEYIEQPTATTSKTITTTELLSSQLIPQPPTQQITTATMIKTSDDIQSSSTSSIKENLSFLLKNQNDKNDYIIHNEIITINNNIQNNTDTNDYENNQNKNEIIKMENTKNDDDDDDENENDIDTDAPDNDDDDDEIKNFNNFDKYKIIRDPNCSIMEMEVQREKLRWLLISECSVFFGDGKHTREGFRKMFLEQEFLQKFYRLFDLDGNGYLIQDKWIEHIKGRLTDEKQIDFAEQLESVAYVICGESKITYRNFWEIWNARGILDKLYRLIDTDAVNLISTNQIMEFISNLTNARPRTGFDKSSLERLELLFRRTVGNEKEIRREEFKKIVTSKNPFFTERVFQIFDKDNSGSISLQEFIDAIHQFAGQSVEDKIKFLFKVYDIDGDGLIQHRELQHVMRACMDENGMKFSDEQIEDLTIAMFEDADPYNRGAITYEALKGQLEKHGGLLENLSITIDRWLVPLPQDKPQTKNRFPLPHQLTTAYIKNNYVFISFLFIYIAINVGLFISRSIQYRHSNGFVILARACGQCLNFNCAWVLVMMLRHSITYLRSRGFSTILPLDHHIYLHKLAGVFISVCSLVHTIMHLFNFSMIVVNDPIINSNNFTTAEWLFTSKPGLFGLVPGCANPTGFALFVILLIMFICSQPFVRRKGSFEVFYWTHLLYVPFWILVLFHGPNFWKWFILPGLIYTIERIIRFAWMKSERGKTYISSGLLLPSKVTHLVIKRPLHFCFRPGDYVFVNIPAIAKYEWHPFTLSSAPEQEDYMWLHIRGVGEWTNRLYMYFEKEQEKLHNGEIPPHIVHQNSDNIIINNDSKRSLGTINNPTPQTDFLSKNLSRINHSTSFDSMFSKKSNDLCNIEMTSNPYNDVNNESEENYCTTLKSSRHQNPGTSKLINDNNTELIASSTQSSGIIIENKTIKNIKASLHRTFSRKEKHENLSGISNDAYIPDNNKINNYECKTNPKRKLTPEKKLQILLFHSKAPLEKSLSMPDIQTRAKKTERLNTLREYARSESERSFDDAKVRKARLQALGMAYLSPQNKSLAQSFKYMRNKPTIIAFKTPSLENCEQRPSSQSMIVSPGVYTQRQAEEGKILKRNINNPTNRSITLSSLSPSYSPVSQRGINYPVGKPLEESKTSYLYKPKIIRSLSSFKRQLNGKNITTTTTNTDTILGHGMEIYIDGPYGAPSSHIFRAQHAVLIGTGIGVTPFASILQSIMHRYWKARHSCPRCNYEWASDIPKTVMNLRKVDFFWINRDQRSFEWFVNLLSQLEIEQAELGGAMERFLEMHMYITSALQKTDMKAVGLQLALDLLHQKEKRDLITGLKTRTNAGRPNWDKVFKQITDQKKGKVTVFYCGPPELGKTLRYKCDQYGFVFRKECF